VICQHGGLGTPETASGIVGNTSNYNHMTERAYQYKSGAHAFAPGLYLWRDDTAGPVHDRAQADIALKQLGGSIAALEVFAIRRVLDYFEKEGFARDGHIGMIGLSYGGSYAVLTAAADTRITAVYSSCQFNNRYIYNRADWVWRNSASSFLDAEIASLIAPRALFLEEGTSDDLFRADTFIAECERTVLFFEAAGASDKLKFRTFEGGHELCKDSAGYDFLFKYI